jgi:homogentisate 1,2-dioxygenase
MSPHGPEAAAFEKASAAELKPDRYRDTMAFMLESRYVIQPTKWALETELRQRDYIKCWDGIKKNFQP